MSGSEESIVVDGDVPRTRNRNVKVYMIAQKQLEAGESVETIAEHYGITVADVYAALTYYYDHKPYFDERDREIERLKQQTMPHSDELRACIEARKHGSKS
jgi:uncharacterized protein (DUF433 family)